MECRHVQTLLHEALERKITPEEQSEMDQHFVNCTPCHNDAVILRAVVASIEEAPVLQPSSDFTLKVMESLPTPVLVFGRIPVAVFRTFITIFGLIAASLVWIYRVPFTQFAQDIPTVLSRSTEGSPVTASLRLAAAAIQNAWNVAFDFFLSYLPFSSSVDTERMMPFASVLIAVGIAYVIVKVVDGFEPAEFDATADQSYSMQ